jgi:uncharacterized integral membrane protein
MRLILWTLKALVFFTLFAFALNNQHPASVKWFFGVEWQAPMVFVVLAAFAAGCALGVLAMVPGRWRRKATARQGVAADPRANGAGAVAPTALNENVIKTPSRDGL